MTQGKQRISTLTLADSIAAAIAVEKDRIELLDSAAVGQVSGGTTTETTASGPTLGYVPPDPIPK